MLRLCEGLVPVPQEALSAPPIWKPLWGLTDFASRAATALSGADAGKTHFLKVTSSGDRVLLVAWSLFLSRAVGLFEVVGSATESDLDDTENVTVTAPTGTGWQGHDGTAAWYASRIGSRWLLGNGTDANLVWESDDLAVFGPASPPADTYDRSRYRIPPCTCFRLDSRRRIFAAGNVTYPMRVWITDEPNAEFPFLAGVWSLETSIIDVHPHKGATRITAISTWSEYLTVHTDRAPVNVFGVEGTSDGWKCQQAASAANASAHNPDCVGDGDGDSAYYFATDMEIYQDESVRGGPWEKRGARAQEIVTEQGVRVWNRQMLANPASSGYHVLHDREARIFWVWAKSIYAGRSMLWMYFERTRACAGPVHYPDAIASTVLSALNLSNTRAGGIGQMQIGSGFFVT